MPTSKSNKKNKRSIEEKYQKIEQHEHVLKRPGMYIGSTKKEKCSMWIFNEGALEREPQIIRKEIKYVPGLFKIFDEVLVNARDHAKQCKSCNKIKVNIDKETGKITIWNNGNGIPVVEHKKHKMLVPSLIFGELLSGSNYDDSRKRTVGGTNGLGAKLANIYSSEFIVETIDAKRDLKFYQKFTNNMYTKGDPKVTPGKKKKPYSKFSFIPDYEKFGLNGLTNDIIALFKKRVYDIAMNTSVKVYYNDELININSFTKYVDIYFPEGGEHKKVLDISNKKWKVCVVYDPTDTIEHQNISFVNGINTSRGGTHVDHVINQIVGELKKIISKKAKGLDVKPIMIKENLIFFVDSVIVNPEFDTQTKEFLKTKVADFGSNYTVTKSLIKNISSTGVVSQIIANANAKAMASLSKTDGKRGAVHYAKLYGAHEANTKNGWKCSLILTEGDSAKTFALSGLNVIGRKYYGVFPLRGKLLNVRDAGLEKIAENDEIKAIKRIVGLEQGKVYTDTKGLRYGKILILTDQDSVTGDTPLLLKNSHGQIEIRTIDDISNNWIINSNGKEYSSTDCQVWTENGWTGIKHVMRHKVKKNIYRILTHTGVVDVTEDHSLLNANAEKISPKQCQIGNELLHNFPRFDNEELGKETNMQPNEAYVMGFFWIGGIYNIYNWSIVNTNLDYLEKCKNILEKYYDYEFGIIEPDPVENRISVPLPSLSGVECSILSYEYRQKCFKLVIKCGQETKIIEKYKNLFYGKEKCIPIEILNASYEIRKNFFDGYCDGTGSRCFDIDSKIGAHGMFFLCKSLGYEVSINHNIKKPKIYCLTLTKGHQQNNPNAIKKIFCIGSTEQYVYDLETENHHFQAGIGQMIVHNTDGSHIKGLIMNLIHTFWPSLMKFDGFIECLATPIVKVTKGKGKKAKLVQFQSLPEYEEWRRENNDGKGWISKYYKGLGTHSAQEAQECFEGIDDKIIKYYWDENLKKEKPKKNNDSSEEISEIVYVPKKEDLCEDAITLAFDKTRANDRKEWLGTYDPNIYIDNSEKKISYYDFIHKELIAFSIYDTQRSVPNIMDGFKPALRKVYYGSIKKNIYEHEIKVAQLSAFVSEHTHYRHGEQSLNDTIIGMAQKFVGTNNINLLLPNGQFGSRLLGGKDAASPRYIFTQLNKLNKYIFIKDDFDILQQQYEEGSEIEPLFYAPIIPMVLVNGTNGIGTGYSTKILPCNPRDIYANLKRILVGENPKVMMPWYRHFTGSIEKIEKNKFISKANYTIVDDSSIRIIDLPIGIWTDEYKEFLEKIFINPSSGKKSEKTASKPASKTAKRKKSLAQKSKTAKVAKSNDIANYVKSYIDDCTEIKIDITIKFHPEKLKKLIKSKTLETKLKLVTNLNNTNMHLFDENGKIKKYGTYGAIMKNFAQVRLDLYQKRKNYLLDKWKKEMDILKWKLKFLENVIDGTIIIFKQNKTKKKEEIIARLEELEFPKFITGNEKNPSYGYITSTGLFHLTTEEVEKLRRELKEKREEIAILEGKTPAQIWEEELDDFMNAYDKWETAEIEEYEMLLKKKKINHGGKKRKAKEATVAME